MRVGIDIMGGDYAPKATIEGAILARHDLSPTDRVVLFGPEETIRSMLLERGESPDNFEIVHAPEVIGMDESPTKAIVQKPDSSITVGFHYLKEGLIDAFSSAGSSGALLVGSIYSVNTIQGIIRPTTAAVLPKEGGGTNVLMDIGTNVDVKPDVLYQFGLLGSVYAENVYGISNPKVGLLSIGEEEKKGNVLTLSAFQLMKDSKEFNFVGNVESRDLFKDKADVLICDGFVGNIVLKQIEAMYRIMMKHGVKDPFLDRLNYENHGGTPILGINSSVVVGHGISNNVAIKNMIVSSAEIAKARLSEKIKKAFDKYS